MKVATKLIPLAFPVTLLVTWPALAGVTVDETLGGLAGPGAGGTVGEMGTKAKGDEVPGLGDGCYTADVDGVTVLVNVDVVDLATGACEVHFDADSDGKSGKASGVPDADGGCANSDATSDADRSFRVHDGKAQTKDSAGTWHDMAACGAE